MYFSFFFFSFKVTRIILFFFLLSRIKPNTVRPFNMFEKKTPCSLAAAAAYFTFQ